MRSGCSRRSDIFGSYEKSHCVIQAKNKTLSNQTDRVFFWRRGWDCVGLGLCRSRHRFATALARVQEHAPGMSLVEAEARVLISAHLFQNKKATARVAFLFWRRGWDSNPRNLAVRLISSQVQSTTLPPLLRVSEALVRL